MRPLDEVRGEVLDAVSVLPEAAAPLLHSLGLALARPVVAPEDVPRFANSAMDGYAVRAGDVVGASPRHPVRLRVVDELPAGREPGTAVGPGEAIRIMTGAPVPDGADAIVVLEVTQPDGAGGVLVRGPAANHVRHPGDDVRAGSVVFDAGEALTPAHLGVLASLGIAEPLVHRRARVGVLSTGDELVEARGALFPGRIRDSNRPMLRALVAEAGGDPVDFGIVGDEPEAMTAVLERALGECDALLTSGGVSVGDYDVVKAVLDRFGVLRWSQVAIKPAKPLAFGVLGGKPVWGLPGNPVSSHVSFELFARPALRRMMGHTRLHRPVVEAIAREPMRRERDGKLHLDRVRVESVDGRLVATRSGAQASHVLHALALANGLALLEDGEGVDARQPVLVMLLGELPGTG